MQLNKVKDIKINNNECIRLSEFSNYHEGQLPQKVRDEYPTEEFLFYLQLSTNKMVFEETDKLFIGPTIIATDCFRIGEFYTKDSGDMDATSKIEERIIRIKDIKAFKAVQQESHVYLEIEVKNDESYKSVCLKAENFEVVNRVQSELYKLLYLKPEGFSRAIKLNHSALKHS